MNGDFDLYVLNGKIKELSEKISSINNSINSIKTEFDGLYIGNPDDTGGSPTEGTMMAKENAIMDRIEEARNAIVNQQIWGKWVTIASISGTVRVQYGETKSTTIKVPEGAWFAYLRTRVSSWTGAARPAGTPNGSITINGKTYPIMFSNSPNVNTQYAHYSITYTGFNRVGGGSSGGILWNDFIPIYPRFASGEIEFAMKLSSQDADYAGYVGGTVEIYFLVGEE